MSSCVYVPSLSQECKTALMLSAWSWHENCATASSTCTSSGVSLPHAKPPAKSWLNLVEVCEVVPVEVIVLDRVVDADVVALLVGVDEGLEVCDDVWVVVVVSVVVPDVVCEVVIVVVCEDV